MSTAKATKTLQSLSAKEMSEARLKILRYDQSQFLGTEIRKIQANNLIPRKSQIGSLRPFLKQENLLRGKSRIENAFYLTYDEKYQIILDRRRGISQMLSRDYHKSRCMGALNSSCQCLLESTSYFVA